MIWDCLRIEVLIAVCVLLIVYAIRSWRLPKKYNLPPGPFNIPLIGSYLLFVRMPHVVLHEMTKKYGDVISVNIGPFQSVSLNSAKSIREAFSKPEFLGRPDEIMTNISTLKMPLFSSGKIWLEHRRFMLRAFRDLGLGKSRMHDLIMEEVCFVLSELEKTEGAPYNVRKILTPSTANNICSLIFGKRYEHDDPERIYMDERIANQAKYIRSASVLAFFPLLKKIPLLPTLLKLDKLQENTKSLENVVFKKIKEHKKTFDEQQLRDLIDIYISEMATRKERDPQTTLSEDCMPGMTSSLVLAGSENVRAAIEWALHTMALYPDIQKKVQQQLDNAVGFERYPMADDMKNLPFLQAVLAELQRWKTVAPVGPLRQTLEDVELFGYNIPKGTLVSANFWAAHNDLDYWKNPQEFDPNRFLTSEGKYLNKHDHFLPFSIGKRACPGEGLALMEIFLYVAAILQKFCVRFPDGEDPMLEEEFTFVLQLKACKLRFIPRT